MIQGLICSLKSNKHTCERETTCGGRLYDDGKNKTVFKSAHIGYQEIYT